MRANNYNTTYYLAIINFTICLKSKMQKIIIKWILKKKKLAFYFKIADNNSTSVTTASPFFLVTRNAKQQKALNGHFAVTDHFACPSPALFWKKIHRYFFYDKLKKNKFGSCVKKENKNKYCTLYAHKIYKTSGKLFYIKYSTFEL